MVGMDHYDEDLFENVFFQTLQKKFAPLFDEATSKRWMVTVPRCGALDKINFELQDFENHILLPVDDQPTVFHTVSLKETSIKGNEITTGEGFRREKTVAILFEETFFNKNDEGYRVLCISQPLEGGVDIADECDGPTRRSLTGLFSYDDCCQVLWGSTGNKTTKSLLAHTVDNFMRMLNKRASTTSLKSLVDQVSALFKKCLNIVLKDPVLKRNSMSDSEMKNNICIAVETYLMQHTYRLVFRHVCTCVADKDEKLNKVTRNFAGLQLNQLSIRPKFCQNVPRARTELSCVIRLTSPMKKLNCLKRVLTVLVGDTDVSFPTHVSNGDDELDAVADLNPFGSDDLLPILVFLIMKTEIPNWWSQWTFMKNFCLSAPLNSEHEFYLSTLEAALEYITTGQLRELRIQSDLTGIVSPASGSTTPQDDATRSLAELLQMVVNNNKEAVSQILKEPEDKVEQPVDEVPSLCHPLCNCPKCLRTMNVSDSAQSKSHPTVLSKNDLGMSAIHVASIFGLTEMVDLLIEKGSDVNAADLQGMTPLHLVAQKGHQKLIMLLLHHNSSINQPDKKRNTALHLASANGHIDCVKALIYIGLNYKQLNLNATNDSCETALHIAARWGFENIVAMLLEHGASSCIPNRKNQLASDVAHNSRIYEMLSEAVLLEKTATMSRSMSLSVKQRTRRGSSLFKRKLSLGAIHSSNGVKSQENLDHPATAAPGFEAGWATCLPQTTVKPKPPAASPLDKKIEKLLKSVADGDIQMVKHHLDWSDYEVDYPEVRDLDITKMSLCHPLCQCDRCYHYQRLTLPSRSGIHLNCQNAQGYTPLHIAAQHGHRDLVHLLLRRGANVNVPTKTHSNTPLHFACKQPEAKIVKLLFEYGEKINATDDMENTPLHYCCLSGNAAHALFLLQVGADVNAVNSRGNTPLHDAIKLGRESIARMLIHCGADVTQRNLQTLTPFSFISTPEMTECVKKAVVQRLWLMGSSSDFNFEHLNFVQPSTDQKDISTASTSNGNVGSALKQDLQSVETQVQSTKPDLQSTQTNLKTKFLSDSCLNRTPYCKGETVQRHLARDDSFHMTHLEAARRTNRYNFQFRL